MKITIISDIHDNEHNLRMFFESIENQNIELILCLGDLMNNGIGKLLAKSKIPVKAIWGNNDGDKVALTKTSLSPNSNLSFSAGTYDTLNLDGKRIFISHYPLIVESIARSKDFDAVFFGNTHEKYSAKIGDCLLVNPGEISAHKTRVSSYAIYDTKNNTAEIQDIENSLSIKSESY